MLHRLYKNVSTAPFWVKLVFLVFAQNTGKQRQALARRDKPLVIRAQALELRVTLAPRVPLVARENAKVALT